MIAASRKKLAITSVFANKDFMDMEQKAEQVRKNFGKIKYPYVKKNLGEVLLFE